MDLSSKIEEENGEKSRSFRYEDYNNRRVFLRSYPLHWEVEEQGGERAAEDNKKMVKLSRGRKKDVLKLKERVLYVLSWSEGKVLLLGKLLISCHPFGFKPSASSLSL